MCTAKADGPNLAIAMGEGKAMGFAIDHAPSAVASFAVLVAIILDEREDFEISRAGKRHAVLGDVGFVFGGVKLDIHIAYIQSANAERK